MNNSCGATALLITEFGKKNKKQVRHILVEIYYQPVLLRRCLQLCINRDGDSVPKTEPVEEWKGLLSFLHPPPLLHPPSSLLPILLLLF